MERFILALCGSACADMLGFESRPVGLWFTTDPDSLDKRRGDNLVMVSDSKTLGVLVKVEL
jgi:hypothetical protein